MIRKNVPGHDHAKDIARLECGHWVVGAWLRLPAIAAPQHGSSRGGTVISWASTGTIRGDLRPVLQLGTAEGAVQDGVFEPPDAAVCLHVPNRDIEHAVIFHVKERVLRRSRRVNHGGTAGTKAVRGHIGSRQVLAGQTIGAASGR
jgi:hypothetical protein